MLISALLSVLLLNIVGLCIAYKKQSDKLTDISYALSFIIVATTGLVLAPNQSFSLTILYAMILTWSFRIGTFLLIRVMRNGKDSRFDEIRNDFVKFGRFWVGQAFASWIIMLPFLIFASKDNASSSTAWIGFMVWLIGLALETVADLQKYRFSNNPGNKGKWIEEGVWRYSRHPNYLGEILVWLGVYLYCVGSFTFTESLFAAASPIFIAGLLIFVSGIPILEKSADKKWGNDKSYQDYKRRTGVLIPKL